MNFSKKSIEDLRADIENEFFVSTKKNIKIIEITTIKNDIKIKFNYPGPDDYLKIMNVLKTFGILHNISNNDRNTTITTVTISLIEKNSENLIKKLIIILVVLFIIISIKKFLLK